MQATGVRLFTGRGDSRMPRCATVPEAALTSYRADYRVIDWRVGAVRSGNEVIATLRLLLPSVHSYSMTHDLYRARIASLSKGCAGRHVSHLRSLIEHHGLLPQRDEPLPRFEAWLTTKLDTITEPAVRASVEQFATCGGCAETPRPANHPRARDALSKRSPSAPTSNPGGTKTDHLVR
jgi:hypothetical protein